MAAVGKEDKCLLSGLIVVSALIVQCIKSLEKILSRQISVLSDVLFLHSKALEALDELFAIVAESFEVFETFEVVESAERRVVLIHNEHGDHFRGNEGQAGRGQSLKRLIVDVNVEVFGQKWEGVLEVRQV